MDVQLVRFPETRVAAIEHLGLPSLEHDTVRKLLAWKLERGLRDPMKYRWFRSRYAASDFCGGCVVS